MPFDPGNTTPAIEATALVRRFGAVQALDCVSLTIGRGEFFSLLGPSGCGKTTLLRIVAGLDFPDSGQLRLNGSDLLPIPAHRRPVNTVFQSYALFPHLTVVENIGFGLRMKKAPRAEITERVRRVMDLVQVTSFAERKPHQISGGQKQRVALARAIVNEPEVLLLDEPLGALDVKLRRELQEELHALQRRLGITFIHVTHDQDEALGLSDRLAVMDHGCVVQVGAPDEIYLRPRNAFVAQFVGGCNLIPATCERGHPQQAATAVGLFNVVSKLPAGSCVLAIRPERVVLGKAAKGVNTFVAVVKDSTYTGPETHVVLSCGSLTLKAVVLNSGASMRPSIGDAISVMLPPDALLPLEEPPGPKASHAA